MAKVIVRAGKIGGVILIPILLLFLIFYALHVSSSAQDVLESSGSPESSQPAALNPDKLTETIAQLRASCKYSQIQTLCGEILSIETNPDLALVATQAIIETAIETRDAAAAETQTQTLLAVFANHLGLARSLDAIGDCWRAMRNFDKARQMYQSAVICHGNPISSMWAQTHLATMDVQQRNPAAADQDVDVLLAGFADQADIPLALCSVGDAWQSAVHYPSRNDKAAALYRLAIDRFPDHPQTLWAYKNLAVLSIEKTKQTADVASLVSSIIAHFGKEPQVARAFCEIGDAWRRSAALNEAQSLYEWAVANHPASEYGLWAQKNLVEVLLAKQDNTGADLAADAFLRDWAAHPNFVIGVSSLGDVYRKAGRADRAERIYLHALSVTPRHPDTLWAQKNLCTLFIDRKESTRAQSAIDSMAQQFKDHPQLPNALFDVAETYRNAQDNAAAMGLYQTILSTFPGHNFALWSTQKMIVMAIDESEKTNATSEVPTEILDAVDKLIDDYQSFDILPLAVLVTGEVYYNAGLALERDGRRNEAPIIYARAIPICERLIRAFPNSDCTASAYYVAAMAYDRMNQTGSAISYRAKILEYWPGYENADSAQCLMASNYERLAKTTASSSFKSMSSKEYAALMENYPDSRYAPYAINKLGGFAFEEKDYPRAAMYFEKLCDNYETKDLVDSTPFYRLGQTYEMMGMKDQAVKAYERFEKASPMTHPLKKIVNNKLQLLNVSK